MRAHLRPALALVFACLGSGCGTLEGDAPVNQCKSDADCSAGQCDGDLGTCVSAPSSTLEVGLEVVPSSEPFGAVTVVPVSFPSFPVDGKSQHDLHLPVLVPTTGKVRQAGQWVTANVRFDLVSQFPGGPPVSISTQSLAQPTNGADGYQYNYSTQLLPGRQYHVTVQPNGDWRAKLPPQHFLYQSPEGASTRLQLQARQDLDYPDMCPPSVIAGPIQGTPPDCLVPVEGTLVDGAGNPQDGLLVQALETTTGGTLSSLYTTGSDPALASGNFRILMHVRSWLDTESWFFRITPSAERTNTQGPGPRFSVDPTTLYEDHGQVTILMPDVSRVVSYTGIVEEAGRPGHGVDGASVRLTSQNVADSSTGVVGTFTTTARTGSDGSFRVSLLPGDYEVLVTPSGSRLGVYRVPTVTIGGESASVMGQLFEVPDRAALGGTVQTPGALGMVNARVEAQARGGDDGGMLDRVAIYARSNDTLTDPNGRFALALDIGLYDVVVQPPAGTMYPWTISRDLAIGGSAAPLTNNFELSPPVPLTGTASWGQGTDAVAVANGEVRAYAVVRSQGAVRAIQIGRTTTDADGHFTLLLPPTL